ncbi:MAG: hypothetical protein M1360_03540 [Candidatus Marsarchaeota archaeon]|jgi:RecJ-like exonuclease|nr:hypothetical protein [Candidatus Marsarchaeota archaeon]MCL5418986.1 hypothetical protein [Candidatus Marsarchaeota archaeon]
MPGKYRGVLSSIKYGESAGDDICTIISSSVSYRKMDGDRAEVGDMVEVSDESMRVAGSRQEAAHAYERMLSKIIKGIYSAKNIKMISERYNESVLKAALKMSEKLNASAHVLLGALVSGAPIVVRFHNDGDGASGATALYRAVTHICAIAGIEPRISWRMNRSIAYSLEDFYFDKMFFQGYKSIEKPVVMIIDFGTNKESEQGLAEAGKECSIIMLDHHIPYKEFESVRPKDYINPWDFEGDSNFTAGALAAVFAELMSGMDLSIFEKSSFISDFSSFADFVHDIQAEKIAVVLDYLTSTKRSGKSVSPGYIDSIISSAEELDSTYSHARNLMSEAIDAGLRAVKTHKIGATSVNIVDFRHVLNGYSDYPLPGRFSSAMQRKFESLNGPNTITIVHYGNFASVRLSKEISQRVNILAKIKRLGEETGGLVSGGGHMEAASIKASEASMERTLKRLMELLGEKPQQ